MANVRVASIVCASVLLAGCASTPRMQTRDLGNGVYEMTKRSGAMAVRSSELKAELEQQALDYCRPRGGALESFDSKTVDPDPPEYSSATIQFRCVKP